MEASPIALRNGSEAHIEKVRAAAVTDDPLVSVIIPTYNYASYLPRAVGSCLDQSHRKVEIIVVDDGSTDGTADVVREMGGGVIYVAQENKGVSSARNAGLSVARGEFVVFLDADDYLTADALETRLRAFLDEPDMDFVITATYSRKAGGDVLFGGSGPAREFVSDIMDRMLLERRIPFATCAVLVRSQVAKQFVFPLHLSNGEDIVYFTKVFFRRKGTFISRPTAVTFSHQDSLRHRMEEIERQGNALMDTIFDDPYYEGGLNYLRRNFTAYRNLEFFRRFYRTGNSRAAGRCLARAVAASPMTLLKVDYLLKFLRLSVAGHGSLFEQHRSQIEQYMKGSARKIHFFR
jgi:glycosyltransferase involved in cell wall biosynthesis